MNVRILAALVATSLAFAATAAAAPKKIVLGHDSWIGYSGVFVAAARGEFSKAGLDVELKVFPTPGDTLAALAAGKLDAGLGTLQNLALLAGKSDFAAAAVYLIDSSHGADAVIARPGIDSVAALKGKKIGVTLGEANHLLLLAALEKAGLKESDVKLIDLSGDNLGSAFVAGSLDAVVTWEPWITKARSTGGKVVFSTVDLPDTIINAVVIPKKSLEPRAKDWAALLGAIDRGVRFLRAEPAAARPLIAKALNVPPEEVPPMLEGDRIYDRADNAALLAPGGTGFGAIRRVIDFITAQKLISRPLEPSDLLDARFVAP